MALTYIAAKETVLPHNEDRDFDIKTAHALIPELPLLGFVT